ncbi:MAG TPA: SDR family NAD(P)-dependent oxidoreductase [Anaerolineales bacterium]|nr:SDR family NAD(P)-dependent oxidoreductase [Anaerolineales bacterium]
MSSSEASAILVWGSAGGIGAAVASHFAEQGYLTLGVSRSGDAPAGISAYASDFADATGVQRVVQAIAMEHKPIDLLVFAAGDIAKGTIAELPAADVTRIFRNNLLACQLAIHASLPLLAEKAHIVILSAMPERVQLPGLASYAAAKAGVDVFAEILSREQRQHRVTVVRPLAVDTPLWQKAGMPLPRRHIAPSVVAQAIEAAHTSGYRGNLDV